MSKRLDSIIHNWHSAYGLPDYVKVASSTYMTEKDPGEDGSKAGLWLSALDANYNLAGTQKEAALKDLEEKAEYYGPHFVEDIKDIRLKLAAECPRDKASDYAIPSEKWGAIRSPAELNAAQSWMSENWDKLSSDKYCAMFNHLVKKAEEYSTELDKDLVKAAFTRVYISGIDDEYNPEAVQKISSYISDGLFVLKSGSTYHSDQLKDMDAELLKEAFGDDLVSEISNPFGKLDPEKAAEVLPTLPTPDAELFDDIMKQAGHNMIDKAAEAFDIFEEV